MKLTCGDKKKYICLVNLNKDLDLTKLRYEVDNKTEYLILSNKTTYAIYLGSFHSLYIEDNPYIKLKISPISKDFDKFFQKNKFNYSKQDKIVLSKENLSLDSDNYTGEDLYGCFKKLHNLAMNYAETKETQVLETIIYGLNHLITNYYQGTKNYNGNWWPYEIGIPKVLCEILVVIYNDVEKEKIFKYLNIINFYLPNALYIFYRRNWPYQNCEVATYANLADNIYICTLKAIMFQDQKTLKVLFKLLNKVIETTTNGDGFYADGSFIQHKNIPYNASYGEVLLNSLAKILKIFKSIKFNIDDYLNKIIEIIKLSYEPFLYNGYAIESTRGRAVARKKLNSNYSYNVIVDSIKVLNKISNNGYLKKLLNNLELNKYDCKTLVFNSMDRYIVINKNYALSFNNNSQYIANYESINDENKLGYYSANGTYEVYYNNQKKRDSLDINPYYRIGSTNPLREEEPNIIYSKNRSIGVCYDNLLNVYFVNDNDYYKGQFSRFILKNSIVVVGNRLRSKDNLHHTIWDAESIIFKDGVAKANQVLIRGIENAKLVNYDEERSYFDLNSKEEKIKYNFQGQRLIFDDINKFNYQVYPLYNNIIDKYHLEINADYHMLKYLNYIFLNSFTNKEIEVGKIKLIGKSSIILKKIKDLIILKIAVNKRSKTLIKLQIKDYKIEKSTIDFVDDTFIFQDELEHEIVFRRNNEKN